MSHSTVRLSRRRFLTRAAQGAGLALTAQFIPGSALGLDGAVPPSEQIVLGGLGIGSRGGTVLACFMEQPDVRIVACADPRADRRTGVKRSVDAKYGKDACTTYSDFRELLARPDIDAVLITTGSNWHALLSIHAAKAGKDVYCEKPCTKTIAESLALAEVFRRTARVFQGGMQGRHTPVIEFATALAREGKLGKLHTLHAQDVAPTMTSGWLEGQPEPGKDVVDWNMFLGPAAWRPYHPVQMKNAFEKGGGMVGTGCLEWGSHCVNMCQWANRADDTVPVEYFPLEDKRATCTICQWRETGAAQRWLAANRRRRRPLRGRDRLGRGELQRWAGRQLAVSPCRQAASRGQQRCGPRPRFPRLRQIARADGGQRPRGVPVADRLPCVEHRRVLESQAEVRSAEE